MPEYKIYSLNKNGLLAGPPDIVECLNDEAAIGLAKKRRGGHIIEVWEGDRAVRLEPK